MEQQTAVRKLIDYIIERGFELEYEMEMSFLDMEKEQIEKAFNTEWSKEIRTGEQYYNETYNK
jgi:hypothetical protein